MSSASQRLRFAVRIFEFEARADSKGRLKVERPAADRAAGAGGSYQVAGINNRYHPLAAARLRELIQQGEHQAATELAVSVIAEYTDPVENWSSVPAVEAFLRDSAFERGRGGAARILQMAVGTKVDGAVGMVTLAATRKAQARPKSLLKALRTARERYELSLGDQTSKPRRRLTNRWDAILEFCLEVLGTSTAAPGPVKRAGKTGGGKAARTPAGKPTQRHRLDARPDTMDFRDRFFETTLNEVPVELRLTDYLKRRNPVLDQGAEGACTGFALAAVANLLLILRRDIDPRELDSSGYVSARMLYAMARRYDEWPGSKYEGSSARGAMKGWHKHGVCRAALWPHKEGLSNDRLTQERAADATGIPLGAYLRIDHLDIVALHSALTEVGVLYATSSVHDGWDSVGADGMIGWEPEQGPVGGHAFALVGYDATGFWLQNSWGRDWGRGGCAHIQYDDWLAHATDVWVARLAAPIRLTEKRRSGSRAAFYGSGMPAGYSHDELRPHIISIGRDGELRGDGQFATSPNHIAQIFDEIIPRAIKNWQTPHLLLYAHGGLTSEKDAVATVARILGPLSENQVFPIAFSWNTDAMSTMRNIISRAWESLGVPLVGRAGFFDALVERWDETLEVMLRAPGKALWDEMKLNAIQATRSTRGGARILAERLRGFLLNHPKVHTHMIGHSAGTILLSGLAQKLATPGPITSGLLNGEDGFGHRIRSLNFWAPACTTALFKDTVAPLLRGGDVARFNLFLLNDSTERADTVGPYRKSLLYLVSNACETEPRTSHRGDGTPILGLKKFCDADPALRTLLAAPHATFVAPEMPHSQATTHGGFDNDQATFQATMKLIAKA